MAKLTPEAKVGIFVLIGIILLVYMSLRVGGIQFGRAEGYEVYIRFESAAGLDNDAPVRVAGVEIGRVKGIALQNTKAKVVLRINPDVKIVQHKLRLTSENILDIIKSYDIPHGYLQKFKKNQVFSLLRPFPR